MTGTRVRGLFDLISAAYERCVRPWQLALDRLGAWATVDEGWAEREDAAEEVMELAEEALGCAGEGEYRNAWQFAGRTAALETFLLEDWEPVCALQHREPTWGPLREACELAARIDTFLEVMARHGPGPALAGACRTDLEALAVLADWCEEHGQPAAAAEARHLDGLARALGS
jgi:hypothetical protein